MGTRSGGTLSGGTLSGDDPTPNEPGDLGGDSGGTLSGDFREPDQLAASRDTERVDAPDLDVEKELGRGGMGVVYVATQRSLGRVVAVKTLRSELTASAAAEKFEAEALVTGRLQHPNIPPVHAYGRDAAGRPFLCMKLVKGLEWGKLLEPMTDEARTRAAKLDRRDHIEIVQRVSEALAYAHAHGIIHRDLKPENVMVGEFGEVLVMDWGIALDLNARKPDAAGAGPRRPVGTPAYMAPEMAAADESKMGPWTDVYLLGGMLYELLTGTTPHQGESVMEVLLAAGKGAVEPPQQRAPDRAMPEALCEITMKALDPDPAKRYQTAIELERAIDDFLDHEASLNLSAAAILGLEQLEAQLGAGDLPPTDAYPRFAACVAELKQAQKLWDGNLQAGDGLDRARLDYAAYAIEHSDLGLAEAQLDQVPPGDPKTEVLRERIAAVRARAAAKDRRRRVILGVLALTLVFVAMFAAGEFRKRQRRQKAVGYTDGTEWLGPKERIQTYIEALAIDPGWPEGHTNLARAYMDDAFELCTHNPEEGAAQLEKAIPVLDRAIELEPHSEIAHGDRGYVFELLNHADRAIADYRRAYELAPKNERIGPSCYGSVLMYERKFEEAEAAYDEAIKLEPSEADFFMRSVARFVMEKNVGALDDVKKAIKYSTSGRDDEWYYACQGIMLIANGRLTDGAERLVAGIRYHKSGPHVLPVLAYVAAKSGDLERALALQAKARAVHERWKRCYLAWEPNWAPFGDARGKNAELGKAVAMKLDLATVVPKHEPEGLKLRKQGEDAFRRGEYDLALAFAGRALAEEPSDGSARFLRGQAYLALGHIEAGERDLEIAPFLAPNREAEIAAAWKALKEKQGK